MKKFFFALLLTAVITSVTWSEEDFLVAIYKPPLDYQEHIISPMILPLKEHPKENPQFLETYDEILKAVIRIMNF